MNTDPGDQLVDWLWVVLPLASLIATLALAWRTHRFLARATRAPGRIVEITTEKDEVWRGQGQGRETVTTYFAHVVFSTPNGSTIEFRSAGLNASPTAGGTVTVAYEPADPKSTARIDDGVIWRPTALVGGLTVVLSLVSLTVEWGQPIMILPLVVAASVIALPFLLRRLNRR